MAQDIANWVSDFTGADTNDPQSGDTPDLGAELREIKAVIRGESLIKWFESTKIAATYVSGGDTFDVALASLDPTVVPGDVMLLTITGEPAEVWALVTDAVDNSTNRRITVYTSATLDSDLTHIRRSIFVPAPDPSMAEYDHAVENPSTLPFQNISLYARLNGVNSNFTIGLPFFVPSNLNYRVFVTPLAHSGVVNGDAYIVKGITKGTSTVVVTFNGAPGGGTYIDYAVTIFLE